MRIVLSLFDGMSCGQIALNRCGIKYDSYYAAEIDKHAITVTQANYPNTIQLGDVTKWNQWDIDWSKVDLLLAGSPCQGFSFAGKQLAFDDPRSALFFVFVDIWKHIQKHNPDAKYLLENVRMKKEHEAVINEMMGIEPLVINSALLSAQNRVRLYWTNIANERYGLFGDVKIAIAQPEDKGILLKDVLENEVDEKYYLSDKMIKTITKHGAINTLENNKSNCLLTTYHKMGGRDQQYVDDTFIASLKFGRNEKAKQIRKENLKKGIDYCPQSEKEITGYDENKMNTLTTATNKDNLVVQLNPSKESGGKQPYQHNRVYDPNYKSPCLDTDSGRKNIITHSTQPRMGKGQGGKGHLFKTDQKNYCLDTGNSQAVEYEHMIIRRLTPLECERLQTVPENYTNHVSDTQRYKMLGNGWTVDVICHIFNHITNNQ